MGPGFESLKVHQQSVLLAQRVHLFPFRTQKLSSAEPKILAWRRAGKIGQCWHIVGDFSAEGPPVPIPNTEVKLCWAENTCLATSRKDRSLPTYYKGNMGAQTGTPSVFPLYITIFIFLLSSVGSADRDVYTKRLCIRIYKTAVWLWSNCSYSSLAQSVEHLTVNQGVTGSSPVGGAIFVVRKSYKT